MAAAAAASKNLAMALIMHSFLRGGRETSVSSCLSSELDGHESVADACSALCLTLPGFRALVKARAHHPGYPGRAPASRLAGTPARTEQPSIGGSASWANLGKGKNRKAASIRIVPERGDFGTEIRALCHKCFRGRRLRTKIIGRLQPADCPRLGAPIMAPSDHIGRAPAESDRVAGAPGDQRDCR